MRTIKQFGMPVILVDDEDYNRVILHRWSFGGMGTILQTNISGDTISIGRFILNYDGEKLVDHIDRNIYNNCKENLRLATKAQNSANRQKLETNDPTSQYKGVYLHPKNKKWVAQIHVNNTTKYVGSFENELDAAYAYNNAAIKYHKDFAYLNKL